MKAQELTQRYEAGERDFPGVVIEKEYLGLLKVSEKSVAEFVRKRVLPLALSFPKTFMLSAIFVKH